MLLDFAKKFQWRGQLLAMFTYLKQPALDFS